jgi:hypothetical protein
VRVGVSGTGAGNYSRQDRQDAKQNKNSLMSGF